MILPFNLTYVHETKWNGELLKNESVGTNFLNIFCLNILKWVEWNGKKRIQALEHLNTIKIYLLLYNRMKP